MLKYKGKQMAKNVIWDIKFTFVNANKKAENYPKIRKNDW